MIISRYVKEHLSFAPWAVDSQKGLLHWLTCPTDIEPPQTKGGVCFQRFLLRALWLHSNILCVKWKVQSHTEVQLLIFCRQSVDAGWFLMEFHIAHEQMIHGRKKYLIPLVLDNVKPGKIKDADLRMYVESHTYLDCKDQVRCGCIFYCHT